MSEALNVGGIPFMMSCSTVRLTALNTPQSCVKCVVPVRTADVLPSPRLSSVAPLPQ